MRWRTSSSSANETAATSADRGAAEPLDVHTKQPEAEQHHEGTNSSTSSSPLTEQESEGAADISLSASASMMGSGTNNMYTGTAATPRPAAAIDPAADSSSTSAADPDGDPPYKRSQQIHRQQALSTSDFDSNDGEDMDALPALEAVNPEDGDDDVDDDTGDDQEIPWKPQGTQSTCEFTHTITNYSQKRDSGCKKAEYSATTVDEFGNRWRLIVYVNGNGRASNHHLSLFLQVRTHKGNETRSHFHE